jgi:SpoVK/Ycf46/Vps4 family AAA+-type ATPase
MTHWDGLSSTHAGTTTPQRILILGATNRIQDIDEAILRRMPKKFPVGLPTPAQRHNIFSLILRGTKIDHADFDLDYLVRMSEGMSGSDIKEACRDAAMGPVREVIRRSRSGGGKRVGREDVRGLRTGDFFGGDRAKRALEELDEVVREVEIGARGRVHTASDDESGEEVEADSEGTTSSEEQERLRRGAGAGPGPGPRRPSGTVRDERYHDERGHARR